MRVLLVSHCLPPDNFAGVELYTEHLARGLAAAGHGVTILTRRLAGGAPALERETRADGIDVRRIRGPGFRGHASGLLDTEVRALSREVTREIAPELVHCTHLMNHSPFAVADFRRAGAAVVLSLLDAFPLCPRAHLFDTEGRACDGARGGLECGVRCFADESARRRRLWCVRARHFERLLGSVDRLLCPSQFVVDRYLPLVPEPSRVALLPLPLLELPDGERPSPHPAEAPGASDPFEIAFVGALVPEKGCDLILDALATEAPARTRLRLIGQAPLPAYREHLVARASGIRGLELEFLPCFAPGALHAQLRGVDVVIVPSRVDETFSLVAREALAGAIPVLASNRGALPEVVRDGFNGYLFDPGSPRDLADRILAIARSAAHREALARGALATPFVRLATHVAALLEEYRRALASRRPVTVRERLADLVRLPRPRRSKTARVG